MGRGFCSVLVLLFALLIVFPPTRSLSTPSTSSGSDKSDEGKAVTSEKGKDGELEDDETDGELRGVKVPPVTQGPLARKEVCSYPKQKQNKFAPEIHLGCLLILM